MVQPKDEQDLQAGAVLSNDNFKAFDSYSATLGVPMEKRIPDPSDESTITECLQGLMKGEISSGSSMSRRSSIITQ